MITYYKRGNNSVFNYSQNIQFLDKPIKFTEGLNLIIGPNGSGKSTLINSIANLFFAYERGYTSFNGLIDIGKLVPIGFFDDNKSFPITDVLYHSGHPILFDNQYVDQSQNFEFYKKDAIDFFVSNFEGKHRSSGEKQLYDFNTIFTNRSKLNDISLLIKEYKQKSSGFADQLDLWHEWFQKGIKVKNNTITILMDESTSYLDVVNKINYWNNIEKILDGGYQLIIATHDIIPLLNKNFRKKYVKNIIETHPGFLEKIDKFISKNG